MTISGITKGSITLNWTKPAGATSYEGNGGALIGWTNVGDVATVTFTALSANTQYTLQVRAVNADGASAAVSATTRTLPNPPTTVTADNTVNSITARWTAGTGGAANYELSIDGTNWVEKDGDDTEHTFTGLLSGRVYTLRVRAKNSSGLSTTVTLATWTRMGPPTGLTTSGITQTAITLNWTKLTRATSYQVNGGALTGWTNAGDVATYTFTGLTANTQYTLQVRALNQGGESGAVSAVAKTLPNAPTSPTTSAITANSIKLSWTASVGGADSYEVSSDGGTNWVDSGGTDTEHTFTGLNSDTAYTLQARAKNSGGVSAAVSATARTLAPSVTPTPAFTLTPTPTIAPSDTPTPTASPTDTLAPTSRPAATAAPRAEARPRERKPTRTPTPIFSTCRWLPSSIIVSGFYESTQCQQVNHLGVAIEQVIAAGIVDAVDVWSWVPSNLQVCFRNQGSLIFLDSANAPKFPERLPAFQTGDLTCAIIDRAGTVVLLRTALFPVSSITALEPNPSLARRLENCMVTLQAHLNFRDAPAGSVMSVLPASVRLTALERSAGWFKVDWYGRRGWVSADYVRPDGDC